MISILDTSLSSLRDRALLVSGFVLGVRRSELIALDIADLELSDKGYLVTIRRSKTDQEGISRTIVAPYSTEAALCPVRAIVEWIEAATITEGPLFRRIRRGNHLTTQRLSAQSVALVVKRSASLAGLDPSDLAAHSLRSGFATTAAANGATERAIANQTGHRSMTVLRRYIQRATAFDDNAANDLGL